MAHIPVVKRRQYVYEARALDVADMKEPITEEEPPAFSMNSTLDTIADSSSTVKHAVHTVCPEDSSVSVCPTAPQLRQGMLMVGGDRGGGTGGRRGPNAAAKGGLSLGRRRRLRGAAPQAGTTHSTQRVPRSRPHFRVAASVSRLPSPMRAPSFT